jgi:hypothetical protein
MAVRRGDMMYAVNVLLKDSRGFAWRVEKLKDVNQQVEYMLDTKNERFDKKAGAGGASIRLSDIKSITVMKMTNLLMDGSE